MTVTWIDMLGYLASASVLATFCMRTMTSLRIMALVSNVLFVGFGALAHVYPVMILHLVLVPVNAASLLQLCRSAHGGSGAAAIRRS
jgi:CRP/FNR family transcriptional regulator, cyclic AMP receptor protein